MSSDNTPLSKWIVKVHEPPKQVTCNALRDLKLSLFPHMAPEHIYRGREDAGNYVEILKGAITGKSQATSVKEFRDKLGDIIFRVSPFDFSEEEMELLFGEERRGIAKSELIKVRKALKRIDASVRFIDGASALLKDAEVDTNRLQSIAEQGAINAMLDGADERAGWTIEDSPKLRGRCLPTQSEIDFHINRILEQQWMLTNSLGLISGLIIREERAYNVGILEHIEPALELLGIMCNYIDGNLPRDRSSLLKHAIWRIRDVLPQPDQV